MHVHVYKRIFCCMGSAAYLCTLAFATCLYIVLCVDVGVCVRVSVRVSIQFLCLCLQEMPKDGTIYIFLVTNVRILNLICMLDITKLLNDRD